MTEPDRADLMKQRTQLINKSTRSVCYPCADPIKTGKIMRYDDPIISGCRCDKIQHLVDELIEVEAKLGLKRR